MIIEQLERLAQVRAVSRVQLRPDIWRQLVHEVATRQDLPGWSFVTGGIYAIGGMRVERRRRSAEACGCDEAVGWVCRQHRGES